MCIKQTVAKYHEYQTWSTYRNGWMFISINRVENSLMAVYVCLNMRIRNYINHDLCGQLTVYVYNDVKHYQLRHFYLFVCVCVSSSRVVF